MNQQPVCMGCYVNQNWLYPPTPYEEVHVPYTRTLIEPSVSLTDAEKEVLSHLVQAWEKFVSLPNTSEHNLKEYQTAIHACQQLIALRVARRADPDVWKLPD